MNKIYDEVIKFMNNNANLFMKLTLGDEKDEYNELYSNVYCYEWRDCIEDFARIVKNLKINNYDLDVVGLTYMFIVCWSGVIIFEHKDLNIEELKILFKDLIMFI